jgi:hypothetical protein
VGAAGRILPALVAEAWGMTTDEDPSPRHRNA